MALDLSTLTTEQQLAAIYIGYYDRAADPVGADFWEGAVANPNLSLADIATDFATQPETLIAYPFLDAPTAEEAEGFIAEVYLNLFNRAPDAAGLEFWSTALLGAIDGTGELSVGEIILAIIGGAQNSEDGQDLTTILNKIEVSTTWTSAADAAAIDYTTDSAAQSSAKSIIEGVTDEGSSVTAAKATIDGFFEPQPVPGNTYFLTSGTDRGEDFTGTSDDDEFLAYIEQNPFVGGVSNSLSSADHLDGGAGSDRLYAELVDEFFGTDGDDDIDVQPRVKNIEEIDIEARDGEGTIHVDGKWITDHEEIGSYFSDEDLVIENLTTLTSSGVARNTSEITITMDHTGPFNSNDDASDLTVYFDNDYLLSGQEAEGKIFYFLLDEDAELAGNPNRLNNIDVDGIRFTIDTGNGPVDVTLEAPEANVAGTHQGFVNALQAPLQALIADGTLPAGTTLTLDPTVVDDTFLDNGQRSDDIPAIVLTSGDGSEVIATGFSRIEEEIGEYDVYGRFNSENDIEDQPISVNIDLHKVGRGGEGGDLVIGGKAEDAVDGIAGGIEVFNINVLGAGENDPNGGMNKPSSLGTVTSTLDALEVINIATDPVFAAGDTYASLEIRDGFDDNTTLVNADAFLGDLMLGTDTDVVNLDTLTAQGGGDITFFADIDGTEEDTAYSYTTGGGDDLIAVDLDGDATDYANSSLNISTGGGEDEVYIDSFNFNGSSDFDSANERLNQAILQNAQIDTGADDDYVELGAGSKGNFKINGGSGDDFINTGGYGFDVAGWAFNFDDVRVDDTNLNDGNDLPGVQTSLAYIGGATVTVTLSGAGIDTLLDGGGVMALGEAVQTENGYEASFTISTLLNGNDYYGDQRDVNAAVIAAIENDAVLSNLLTVEIAENNTLVIESTTSGDFDEEDLRIDIEQADQDSWTDVQSEARSVFSNSGISVTSVASANAASPNDLTTSANANDWWDGLSVEGDVDNSADDNQFESGDESIYETDNTINGGDGDDLIVLSTDAATFGGTFDYTVSSNNKLANLASNETIVMTGTNFGNDTIMNFTTDTDARIVAQHVFNILDSDADLVSLAPEGATDTASATATGTATDDPDVTVLVLSGVLQNGANLEVTLTQGDGSEGVAAAVVAAINANSDLYTAEAVLDGTNTATDLVDQIVLTAIYPNGSSVYAIAGTDVGFVVEDRDLDNPDTNSTPSTTDDTTYSVRLSVDSDDIDEAAFGITATNTTVTGGIVTYNTTVDSIVARGLDFLDFTAYLTSEEDISGGAGDSSDSNNVIPVTLDYNEDATASGNVEANEVVVVRMTDDATESETFSALSATVVANLFNDSVDTDNEWGSLTEANLNAATYQKTDQEALIGDGKAIFMVENGSNLGEYKVFELTWSGDNSSASGDVVSATELGSLDFGTSLTDIAEVNLIGSEAYANLDDLNLFG